MMDSKLIEIKELLDRHPEMYDQILQLLKAQVSDPATTQGPAEADD